VLSKDSVEMEHWSMELAPNSAADVGHFGQVVREHRTGQLKLLAPLAGPRKDARAGFLWRGARRDSEKPVQLEEVQPRVLAVELRYAVRVAHPGAQLHELHGRPLVRWRRPWGRWRRRR
jgi:hypothetical protein